MPSTSRCGVVSTLPKDSLPVLSSNTAISVKVPPISAANRRPGWPEGDAVEVCFVISHPRQPTRSSVMRGLVPRIHALLAAKKDVEGRDKPGHDVRIFS